MTQFDAWNSEYDTSGSPALRPCGTGMRVLRYSSGSGGRELMSAKTRSGVSGSSSFSRRARSAKVDARTVPMRWQCRSVLGMRSR